MRTSEKLPSRWDGGSEALLTIFDLGLQETYSQPTTNQLTYLNSGEPGLHRGPGYDSRKGAMPQTSPILSLAGLNGLGGLVGFSSGFETKGSGLATIR